MLVEFMVVTLGVGAALFVRSRERTGLERMGALLLPSVLLVAAWHSAGILLDAPWDDWNAARLTPTIAILRGIDPYAGPQSGSIQSTMYPPADYLAYLPAGLAGSPTSAIVVGNALSQFYVCVGAFLLFVLTAGRDRRGVWAAVLGAAFFVLFGGLFQPTLHHLRNIHADAPALCLGLLSCAFVFSYDGRRRWTPCAAATCAILSVWAKQTLAPVAIALLLFVAWQHGRRAGLTLLAWLAVLGLAIGGLMLALVPFPTLYFQTVSLPASFELRPPGLAGSLRAFLRVGWPTLAAFTLVLGTRFALPVRVPRSSLRQWARAEPVLLLIVAAAFLTPISLLGYVKYGGSVNSFHNLYFLQTATVCALIGGVRERAPLERGRAAMACSAYLVLGVIGLALAQGFALSETSLRKMLADLGNNPQQEAYEYTRQHPGQVWFPRNPLSNLMAEDRLEHQDRAVSDWNVAGQVVSAERLLESIRPGVTLLAYPPWTKRARRFVAQVFGQQPGPDIDSLDGWMIFQIPR